MQKKTSHLTIFFTVLLLASLACSVFAGGPEYPAQTVPFSADEVQTMQITESQLTAYITQKMQEQTDPPFTEPLILLRDGQMQMYGKVESGMIKANILITMNVGIDETSGLPKIEIVSADFGPIPAPEGLNTAISAMIDEAFTGSLGPVAIGFRLESITIADGIMTLTGRTK